MTVSMTPRARRVLVVEDDPDLREALQLLIESASTTLTCTVGVEDGAQAMQYLEEHAPPCLILLDLMMPRVDGWQVLDWLRRHPRLSRVPVLLVSAVGPDRARQAMALHDGAAYLPKPPDSEQLMAMVGRHCHGCRAKGPAGAEATPPLA